MSGTRVGRLFVLARKSVEAWVADDASSMGAALAFYTLFSIAPLLYIILAVAGFLFGHDAVQGQIVAQAAGVFGRTGATAVQDLVKSASDPAQGVSVSVISVALLVIGSTSVFAELQSDLDRIWRVAAPPRESGIWRLVRTRLISFGLVLALGFMLLVSLVVSAAIAFLGAWWGDVFQWRDLILQGLNVAVSMALTTCLFALIYKTMPRARIGWRDVWVGAVATATLFEVGKLLIAQYIGRVGVTSGFGAAGSVIVLLVWVYYAAQIFLLGAEFTCVVSCERGVPPGQTPERSLH